MDDASVSGTVARRLGLTAVGWSASIQRMTGPLCWVVLSMLERQQLRVHDVARGLESRDMTAAGAGFPFALATLERLRCARLVRCRQLRGRGAQFALTQRGRRELRLQQMLWLRATGFGPRPRA